MSEKPESDDFDDQDVDELAGDSEDVDLERATKDLELSRKRGTKAVGDPAWRRLEELQEKSACKRSSATSTTMTSGWTTSPCAASRAPERRTAR